MVRAVEIFSDFGERRTNCRRRGSSVSTLVRRWGARFGATLLLGALTFGAIACTGDAGADLADAPAEIPDGFARATFQVDGMTCTGCAIATRMTLKRLDGVRDADASFADGGSAWAVYDPERVGPEMMIDAIGDLGYTARVAQD
ncbi:MAG: heavy-metal-associated domain-containing protein [Acidimicrobiia bacterium]